MTAAGPIPPDRQIGWCEGCSEPILENQPWTEEYAVGLWHVDCLPGGEGGDE